MNVRVLELLQRPENISAEDISVLQNEISKFPYMQSVRTLYLSAIHQFDTDNYQKELTKTAAYTTDKNPNPELLKLSQGQRAIQKAIHHCRRGLL